MKLGLRDLTLAIAACSVLSTPSGADTFVSITHLGPPGGWDNLGGTNAIANGEPRATDGEDGQTFVAIASNFSGIRVYIADLTVELGSLQDRGASSSELLPSRRGS